jgi:hypothetical protein
LGKTAGVRSLKRRRLTSFLTSSGTDEAVPFHESVGVFFVS